MNVIEMYKALMIIITVCCIWNNAMIKEEYKENLIFIMYLIYFIIS